MQQSTGEAKQDARADLASLREDMNAINAQLVELEGQKKALLYAGMRLLLLSRDW